MSAKKRPRVRLVHWKPEEAPPRLDRLRRAGAVPEFDDLSGGAPAWKPIKEDPPDAFVIDLGRLPSHGREAAIYLRQTRSTRGIPLVFVEGDPEKVERIRKEVPDAVYTTWERIPKDLPKAIANPPGDPVRPIEHMQRYAGRPLAKKLGVKPDSVLILISPPQDSDTILRDLPKGVIVRKRNQGRRDLTIWFTRSLKVLERGVDRVAASLEGTSVWIAWPKKSSPLAADHNELDVRRIGLAAGLVDYKICAIDQDWSGLLFSVRK